MRGSERKELKVEREKRHFSAQFFLGVAKTTEHRTEERKVNGSIEKEGCVLRNSTDFRHLARREKCSIARLEMELNYVKERKGGRICKEVK